MEANQEKAIEIAENITDYVNTFSRRDEFNIAMSNQHRTLQQSFTRLCLKWLEHISKEEYRTDLRNQASKEIAQKIIADFKEKNNGFVPSDFIGYV
jgi:hypothetical protein